MRTRNRPSEDVSESNEPGPNATTPTALPPPSPPRTRSGLVRPGGESITPSSHGVGAPPTTRQRTPTQASQRTDSPPRTRSGLGRVSDVAMSSPGDTIRVGTDSNPAPASAPVRSPSPPRMTRSGLTRPSVDGSVNGDTPRVEGSQQGQGSDRAASPPRTRSSLRGSDIGVSSFTPLNSTVVRITGSTELPTMASQDAPRASRSGLLRLSDAPTSIPDTAAAGPISASQPAPSRPSLTSRPSLGLLPKLDPSKLKIGGRKIIPPAPSAEASAKAGTAKMLNRVLPVEGRTIQKRNSLPLLNTHGKLPRLNPLPPYRNLRTSLPGRSPLLKHADLAPAAGSAGESEKSTEPEVQTPTVEKPVEQPVGRVTRSSAGESTPPVLHDISEPPPPQPNPEPAPVAEPTTRVTRSAALTTETLPLPDTTTSAAPSAPSPAPPTEDSTTLLQQREAAEEAATRQKRIQAFEGINKAPKGAPQTKNLTPESARVNINNNSSGRNSVRIRAAKVLTAQATLEQSFAFAKGPQSGRPAAATSVLPAAVGVAVARKEAEQVPTPEPEVGKGKQPAAGKAGSTEGAAPRRRLSNRPTAASAKASTNGESVKSKAAAFAEDPYATIVDPAEKPQIPPVSLRAKRPSPAASVHAKQNVLPPLPPAARLHDLPTPPNEPGSEFVPINLDSAAPSSEANLPPIASSSTAPTTTSGKSKRKRASIPAAEESTTTEAAPRPQIHRRKRPRGSEAEELAWFNGRQIDYSQERDFNWSKNLKLIPNIMKGNPVAVPPGFDALVKFYRRLNSNTPNGPEMNSSFFQRIISLSTSDAEYKDLIIRLEAHVFGLYENTSKMILSEMLGSVFPTKDKKPIDEKWLMRGEFDEYLCIGRETLTREQRVIYLFSRVTVLYSPGDTVAPPSPLVTNANGEAVQNSNSKTITFMEWCRADPRPELQGKMRLDEPAITSLVRFHRKQEKQIAQRYVEELLRLKQVEREKSFKAPIPSAVAYTPKKQVQEPPTEPGSPSKQIFNEVQMSAKKALSPELGEDVSTQMEDAAIDEDDADQTVEVGEQADTIPETPRDSQSPAPILPTVMAELPSQPAPVPDSTSTMVRRSLSVSRSLSAKSSKRKKNAEEQVVRESVEPEEEDDMEDSIVVQPRKALDVVQEEAEKEAEEVAEESELAPMEEGGDMGDSMELTLVDHTGEAAAEEVEEEETQLVDSATSGDHSSQTRDENGRFIIKLEKDAAASHTDDEDDSAYFEDPSHMDLDRDSTPTPLSLPAPSNRTLPVSSSRRKQPYNPARELIREALHLQRLYPHNAGPRTPDSTINRLDQRIAELERTHIALLQALREAQETASKKLQDLNIKMTSFTISALDATDQLKIHWSSARDIQDQKMAVQQELDDTWRRISRRGMDIQDELSSLRERKKRELELGGMPPDPTQRGQSLLLAPPQDTQPSAGLLTLFAPRPVPEPSITSQSTAYNRDAPPPVYTFTGRGPRGEALQIPEQLMSAVKVWTEEKEKEKERVGSEEGSRRGTPGSAAGNGSGRGRKRRRAGKR